MYDARSGGQDSSGGLVFGLVTFGVVAALFAGVLLFPELTGPGRKAVPDAVATEADAGLLAAFEDDATKTYIRKLQATFPAAAQDLERDVKKANARGADKVELGLLVLQAGAEDIAGDIDRLGRADVKYFNALLDLATTSLKDLSRSGAPYCKGSDLMSFAELSQQQLYAAAFDRVGHGAGLYNFGLEFNGIVLDAIRDARSDPVQYGAMTSGDEQALQRLAFSMMANPQIMKLMTLEGKSRREMDAALGTVNFCDLGAQLISQVDSLPIATKGRLWAEMSRQVTSGNARRTLGQYGAF